MKCSGCSACALICPVKCIEIKKNENGFLRAFKDMSKCIGCNLCEQVCPHNVIRGVELDKSILYSAVAKDKNIHSSTSSGGIGFCLAQKSILDKKGVCGVVFNNATMGAEHRVYYSLDGIENIKKSKYIQSENYNAFEEVLSVVKKNNNQKFTVFGTPCQIAGLRNVLENKRLQDNVLLVDIFCHGVPSWLLWEKYLKEQKKRLFIKELSDIQSVIFRDKEFSWHTYYMHIFGNRVNYVSKKENDLFLKLFTMGVLNDVTCFSCPYRNKSAADIRLGDYWGDRFSDREDGVSMVLLNSEKGKIAFGALEESIEYEQHDISERKSQQHNDYEMPIYYARSLEILKDEKKSLKKIIRLYESSFKSIKKKIKEVFILKNK